MLKNLKSLAVISLLLFGNGAVNASYEKISKETSNIIYSYYGEESEKTGRPKTVKVKKYKKKDGTQVDEHYRSKPKRKPKN